MAKSNLVYAGIRGSVVALDKTSGTRVWETKLKGGGFVTLLVEEGRVFAGTQGEIFCLDAAMGNILWQDGLKGYGLGLMSIATKNGSSDMAALAAQFVAEQQDSSAGSTAAAAG
jgi:outer membrane protein assembly factor BamB